MRSKIVVIIMVFILAGANWSIADKEKHLAQGHIVYLELAPVDPRSLMQGDYMALRFQIADEVYAALPKSDDYRRWRQNVDGNDGFVVIAQDEQGIASFKRLSTGNQALQENELLLRYRIRNGAVKFATNAFFFQEGQGAIYESARYGQFRVNGDGELLLAAMYDKDLVKLETQRDELFNLNKAKSND